MFTLDTLIGCLPVLSLISFNRNTHVHAHIPFNLSARKRPLGPVSLILYAITGVPRNGQNSVLNQMYKELESGVQVLCCK